MIAFSHIEEILTALTETGTGEVTTASAHPGATASRCGFGARLRAWEW